MAKSYHPSERVVRHDSYRDGEAILEPVLDRMPAILSSRFIKNAKSHAPRALLTSWVPIFLKPRSDSGSRSTLAAGC